MSKFNAVLAKLGFIIVRHKHWQEVLGERRPMSERVDALSAQVRSLEAQLESALREAEALRLELSQRGGIEGALRELIDGMHQELAASSAAAEQAQEFMHGLVRRLEDVEDRGERPGADQEEMSRCRRRIADLEEYIDRGPEGA